MVRKKNRCNKYLLRDNRTHNCNKCCNSPAITGRIIRMQLVRYPHTHIPTKHRLLKDLSVSKMAATVYEREICIAVIIITIIIITINIIILFGFFVFRAAEVILSTTAECWMVSIEQEFCSISFPLFLRDMHRFPSFYRIPLVQKRSNFHCSRSVVYGKYISVAIRLALRVCLDIKMSANVVLFFFKLINYSWSLFKMRPK